MSADTSPFYLPWSFAPLASEHWGLMLLSVSLAAGLVWMIQHRKIQDLLKAHAAKTAEEQAAHAAALKSQQEAASNQASTAQQKLEEAAAAHRVLEERFQTLRETSQRREQDAEQRISSLSADLGATREIAAQLEPTKARIGDLETALNSERGRVSALEKTAEVAIKRAEDFERRLEQSHRDLMEVRQGAERREQELQGAVAKLSQTIQANETLVATAESQVSQANESLSAYKQQSETRLTNLQRQLAAAEAKAAMVQKEFMSAVGVLPDRPASSPRNSQTVSDDKRVAELEAKINQIEAEARKKAREDGYKIAELEFRLSEAQDALGKKE